MTSRFVLGLSRGKFYLSRYKLEKSCLEFKNITWAIKFIGAFFIEFVPYQLPGLVLGTWFHGNELQGGFPQRKEQVKHGILNTNTKKVSNNKKEELFMALIIAMH